MRRVLICGDRNWTDGDYIYEALRRLKEGVTGEGVDVVIEGEARGADRLGALAAARLGIPVLTFPAKWDTYGRRAGVLRNQQMLDEGKPTLVLAFHDDLKHSRGTKDMVKRADDAGVSIQLMFHGRMSF